MGKMSVMGDRCYEENIGFLLVLGYKLENNKPADIMIERLRAVCDFYSNNPDVVIILSGGKTGKNTISEAKAMQQYLLKRGIPEEIMILDEESRDTYENLVNCRKIMGLTGNNAVGAKIGIVTSNYHMKRALNSARKLGMVNLVAIPAKTPRLKVVRTYLWEVLCMLDFFRKGYL